MNILIEEIERRILNIQQPRRFVFGNACVEQCVDDLSCLGFGHVFLVCAEPVRPLVDPVIESFSTKGIEVTVDDSINSEPDIAMFEAVLGKACLKTVDGVVGLGGGSVLDIAKLVAALLDSEQNVQDVFGIGKLTGRSTYLVCIPTTAGTGSEVSPNAILLDESVMLKKGVVSPWLVPDAAYVDPELTRSVPPDITAATGLDALTHCIEAYANRFAHTMIDVFALKGIEMISSNLESAFSNGQDMKARSALALGSMYGGLCLGPVNTGAVHALAYPLGGEFHIPHGLSNAMLIPGVMEFNLTAMPERYARIAVAMGCSQETTDLKTAQGGVEKIKELSQKCGIPATLSDWGVPREAIKRMAESAMTVTRLLKNNPKELTQCDAEDLYLSLF